MSDTGGTYNEERNYYPYSTGGSGHALASLIIGILAILSLLPGPVISFVPVVLGIVGLVLGSAARRRGYTGSMATIGKIFSIISIIVGIIFVILFILLVLGVLFFGGVWFTEVLTHTTTTTAPQTV